MQIGTTDRRQRYAYNDVAWVDNVRIRHILHTHISTSIPAERLHRFSPCQLGLNGDQSVVPEIAARVLSCPGGSNSCASLVHTACGSGGLPCCPPVGCPSVVAISPASKICFNLLRSSLICVSGSSPKSFAIVAPNAPAGGK